VFTPPPRSENYPGIDTTAPAATSPSSPTPSWPPGRVTSHTTAWSTDSASASQTQRAIGSTSFTPPTKSQRNYPAPQENFNPNVRRENSPGPYWYSKADLHRFYYDPRSYEVNKLEVDQEYYNPRSSNFYSPTYRNNYHFSGTSNFYVNPSLSGLR
jgi:hypothetical protein